MWEAECGSDREPSNEESDEDAREISKRLESEMRSQMDPVLQKLPVLQQQVDVLLAKRETKAQAAPLAAQLKKERERLERLSIQGRWVGANRPYNQLATDYGKEQHGRMHTSFACDLPKDPKRQLRFDGAELRVFNTVNTQGIASSRFTSQPLPSGQVSTPPSRSPPSAPGAWKPWRLAK